VSAVEPYYGDAEAYDAYRRRKEPEWEDLFARLRRYVPGDRCGGERGARLLDVGCARGYSTAVARRLGFDAYGVEVSAADAAYAREQLRLPVRTGTLEQAGFGAGFFDAVVMWSVLEHVTAPVATMAAVARVLRPGGILNIFTPNGESRAAREQGMGWIEYNRPGHVVFFSPPTLRRLLQQQGLEPVELYTTLAGGGPEQKREQRGLARSVMRPRLAPLRRNLRRAVALVAPRVAWEGDYMGVYARKSARR
jgi:SAM-dependent methyltransferase